MDCNTPGFPVLHHLPDPAQTHVHWVGDAIQPSHPLSPPSLPTFNFSQHQGLKRQLSQFFALSGHSIGASTSASVLPLNIQNWFPLGLTSLILQSKGLSRVFSKITADGDSSHEIKRCLLFGRKALTNLWHHIKKQRHYFADKGPSSQSYGFSSSQVWMWELNYKESWALKNWCFWTVVLEKTFKSLFGGVHDITGLCMLSCFSFVCVFVTSWAVAHQVAQSMRFSRQEYWSGLPFPSPGDFLTQGSNVDLLHCR